MSDAGPLPIVSGGFGAILADCPWRFQVWSAKGLDRAPPYATMKLPEIMALPVADLAARDCILFLWATDPMLPQALEVGRAWGFTHKTTAFTWVKMRRAGSPRGLLFKEPEHKLFPMGPGYWTRANPETCLLFTRGKPKRLSRSVRQLLIAPRREHSRKPDEQYARIEALCDGPYLELFARSRRSGWTAWGNEVGKFDPPLLRDAA